MHKRKIVFLGGVGGENTFGGELTKNKEIIRRLREMGCYVTVLDSYKCNSNYPKLLMLVIRFFWNLLFNSDACFIFSSSFNNVYPFIKIIHYYPVRIHLVYWVIGGNLADRISKGVYAIKYLKDVDTFIVEGQKMKDDMESLGFDNVIFVPNFKSIGERLNKIDKNTECVSFVFISRIMPEKGCRYILEAVNELNKSVNSNLFQVDFYGQIEPTFAEEFHRACKVLPNIKYCGVLDLQNEDNYTVLATYHYMLFPTYWVGEGFPGVIIDSFKSGVPVIATDWNLNSEFIKNGFLGYLIQSHSISDLINVMQKCIKEGYNNNYECIVNNCLDEAQKYDTDVVINWNLLMKIMPSSQSKCRSLLKRNKFIYFLYYRLLNKDFKKHYKRYCSSKAKPTEQMKQEMSALKQYWGCSPMHYIRYGLYDKFMDLDQLLDYIPPYFYYNHYLDKQLSLINTNIYEDKLSLYFEFLGKNISTPKVLGIIKSNRLYDVNWKNIEIIDFKKSIGRIQRLFFKPINGRGGNGIVVYKPDEHGDIGNFITMLKKDNIYIIQYAIVQRDDMSEINPTSVNTLRIITQHDGTKASVRACVLRCGRCGSQVDNSDQGGLSVEIDVQTGDFRPIAISEHGDGIYYVHPDSQVQFAGRRLKDWDSIRRQIEVCASQFPDLRDIGWDVALGSTGIVVIEMNLGFGLDHLQITCGGMRRRLNVYPNEDA